MNQTVKKKALLLLWVVLGLTAPAGAASGFDYRIPAVSGPAEPVVVSLDLTSDRDDIASVGVRLTYDSSLLALVGIEKGAGIPASWSFIFEDSATAGEIDVAITDQSSAAATITGPVTAIEVLRVTFDRATTSCSSAAFDFNTVAPVPGPEENAFPENQYVIYVDGVSNEIVVEAAATTSATGPAVDDHGFVRGNLNNRAAHSLDIGDVVDLANSLFGSFVPGFDCAAASDVNDDGERNIVDVVALVQGAFGTSGFVIPPPNSTDPGPGIPGVVTVDGGSIPSVLGCNEGETCP